MDRALDDAPLLALVHPDDPFPVVRALGEAKLTAEVDQAQDILLEARAAESGAGLEEVRPNPAVHPQHIGHLVNVCPGHLAEGREGVNRGDALSEHRVGGELGEFAGPDIRGENALAGDPRGVDLGQGGHGGLAGGRFRSADEHAVRVEEVLNGRAFGQELGVGENGEGVFRVGVQDGGHRVGRAHRQGRLLDDHLVTIGLGGDGARGRLPELQVRGIARSFAEGLGRCVHAHEDEVATPNGPGNVRREEEVAPAASEHNLLQARLIDREFLGVPGGDLRCVAVHHPHLALGAHLGNNGHRWAADVPGADAGDIASHLT